MEEVKNNITFEQIGKFMEGKDPEERIVNLTYNYRDSFVTIFYRNEKDQRCSRKQNFYPFLWATHKACLRLCDGDRKEVSRLMREFGIGIKKLSNVNYKGEVVKEFENGYMYMFFALKPMSYSTFLNFFKKANNPVYSSKKDDGNVIPSSSELDKQYLCVTPQEQFLIATGKRFFKGYDDYDNLRRMIFDLETEGLDPKKHRIKLNGVRLNRPIEYNGKIWQDFILKTKYNENDTEEEKNKTELNVIDQFLRLIYTFKPDVITAHNGENFDWNFIIERCKILGTTLEDLSSKYFDGEPIYKEEKESTLKLGGEVETFRRTIVPNTIVTDSMHAVRRAQATDSNFKLATLKYATKYLELKKDNRVYTPGEEIDNILIDKVNKYAFNNTDGDWYIYDETHETDRNIEFKKGKIGDQPFKMYTRNYLAEGYEIVSGEYIIERYLKDDLWECDKVEAKLNTANFFICKILPVPFARCCTMGTAGQWKAIMLAWSYDNNLAIPIADNEKLTVGGLSRLLNVGYSKNIIKLDYNSLYPSIILTWGIEDWPDLSGVMLKMLEYVLTQREKYKGLKKNADKIIDKYDELVINNIILTTEQSKEYQKAQADFALNDKVQNSMKTLGNSVFGAVSATNSSVFPWKSSKSGHRITCTGRQCLRLLISHFHDIKGPNGETEGYGYKPLVGDSFSGDTPLFIKYKVNGFIDIKPISELIDERHIEVDELGREYDRGNKDYYVLCRSGWVEPSYIYRHKTDKDIYSVYDGQCSINVTEDHSLFDENGVKIKPSSINKDTILEYYNGEIKDGNTTNNLPNSVITLMAKQLAEGVINGVPCLILNSNADVKHLFYKTFIENMNLNTTYSKTCLAGLQYILK